MKTVLSTKILSLPQKELFLNSGLGLVTYDALTIEFHEVPIPKGYHHFIFTSKNAVRAFLKQRTEPLEEASIFCVGDKTEHLLLENGLKVVKKADNAMELAHFIAKNYKTDDFLFLCGNRRRDELPHILSENNIRYSEIQMYTTHLTPQKFDRSFDGILFFSPSGIKSFTKENSVAKSQLFCIGNTTAEEAKKHTDKITIANRPTVENVLVQAINHFKTND